jgi:hypothetical protein
MIPILSFPVFVYLIIHGTGGRHEKFDVFSNGVIFPEIFLPVAITCAFGIWTRGRTFEKKIGRNWSRVGIPEQKKKRETPKFKPGRGGRENIGGILEGRRKEGNKEGRPSSRGGREGERGKPVGRGKAEEESRGGFLETFFAGYLSLSGFLLLSYLLSPLLSSFSVLYTFLASLLPLLSTPLLIFLFRRYKEEEERREKAGGRKGGRVEEPQEGDTRIGGSEEALDVVLEAPSSPHASSEIPSLLSPWSFVPWLAVGCYWVGQRCAYLS